MAKQSQAWLAVMVLAAAFWARSSQAPPPPARPHVMAPSPRMPCRVRAELAGLYPGMPWSTAIPRLGWGRQGQEGFVTDGEVGVLVRRGRVRTITADSPLTLPDGRRLRPEEAVQALGAPDRTFQVQAEEGWCPALYHAQRYRRWRVTVLGNAQGQALGFVLGPMDPAIGLRRVPRHL